jgi:hypothetical protein
MRAAAFSTLVLLALPLAIPSACATPIDVGNDADSGSPAGFASDSDGGDVAPSSETPRNINRCATNVCPPGRVTCPNDPFPCAVDLDNDNDNCGACGVRCPSDNAFAQRFHGVMQCISGACVFVCDEEWADCNGLPEDGCEVHVSGVGASDVNNCGACGNVCEEPICNQGTCGCPPGSELCPDGRCRATDRDNNNCGECGFVCPPNTEPFPPEWRMTRTCVGGHCLTPACNAGFADCDGDFLVEGGNGCETSIRTDPNNCGACGNVCAPGEICNPPGECVCPCGASCFKGLNTDPKNCGTCGFKCPGDWSSIESGGRPGLDPAHGRPVCEQGVCGYECSPHWADCDNDINNGCETDLLNDPLNCGGCGVRCDGIEGQACIDGECLTEPCGVD